MLSVCVSLKNRSAVPYKDSVLRLFRNTVQSLVKAANGISGNVELVVADFGSDDDPPADWIYEQAQGISVKLLHLDGDFSRGRGLNEAVHHSSSKRLLLTDADVLISDSALRRAIELIDQDQAWFPAFHCFDEAGELTHWLDLGYGIVGIERRVFDASGGVPEFESWGGEDDVFRDRVQDQVPGVRERCGGLRHQWHPECIRHENYRNPRKEDYEAYMSQVVVPNAKAAIGLPIASRKFKALNAVHLNWIGPLHFYENGRFVRPGGDAGIYEVEEDVSITLHWDRWPAERLLWDALDGSYRSIDKPFTLQE